MSKKPKKLKQRKTERQLKLREQKMDHRAKMAKNQSMINKDLTEIATRIDTLITILIDRGVFSEDDWHKARVRYASFLQTGSDLQVLQLANAVRLWKRYQPHNEMTKIGPQGLIKRILEDKSMGDQAKLDLLSSLQQAKPEYESEFDQARKQVTQGPDSIERPPIRYPVLDAQYAAMLHNVLEVVTSFPGVGAKTPELEEVMKWNTIMAGKAHRWAMALFERNQRGEEMTGWDDEGLPPFIKKEEKD